MSKRTRVGVSLIGLLFFFLGIVLVIYALYVTVECLFGCRGFDAFALQNNQFIGGLGVVLILVGLVLTRGGTTKSGYGVSTTHVPSR